MTINSDRHIHSRNSCGCAALAVSGLIVEAESAGIMDFGLTGHLHTPYNLPDIVRLQEEFLSVCSSPRFHYEVDSCAAAKMPETVNMGGSGFCVYRQK